jgi:predicted ester cyclase
MKMLVRLMLMGATIALPQAARAGQSDAEAVVRSFLLEVRSGRNPEASARYLAPRVLAHQVTSEGPVTVKRTPADYSAHVRGFLEAFGRYDFVVEELIADGQKVFVRWRQTGRHLVSLDGERPTGTKLVELTSVVYRVENGLIQEYWLQTDRKGLESQLQRSASAAP